jgi:hypothetical protein
MWNSFSNSGAERHESSALGTTHVVRVVRALAVGALCTLASLRLMAAADDAPVMRARSAAPAGHASPTAPRDTSGEKVPELRISRRTLETLGEDNSLAPEVNAGVISRAAFQAELARGIGSFLRQVRTEPAFVRGRFTGWRVLDLFSRRTDVHVQVLRPGDTVSRVNGHAVERPEEFKALWDSLAKASELVLDIQRAGHASKLRYAIAD